MQIVNDYSGKIFECSCMEKQNHQFEIHWNYSGSVKGFIICAGAVDAERPSDTALSNSKELQEGIKKGSSVKTRLVEDQSGEKQEYVLFYVTEAGFRKNNEHILLTEDVKAPAKVAVWWLADDGIVHIPDDSSRLLPVQIHYTLKKTKKKLGFLKSAWFCDIAFNPANARMVPEGAVYYKVGGIPLEYPLNIAGCPVITLKLDEESTSVVIGVFPQYSQLYTVKQNI